MIGVKSAHQDYLNISIFIRCEDALISYLQLKPVSILSVVMEQESL